MVYQILNLTYQLAWREDTKYWRFILTSHSINWSIQQNVCSKRIINYTAKVYGRFRFYANFKIFFRNDIICNIFTIKITKTEKNLIGHTFLPCADLYKLIRSFILFPNFITLRSKSQIKFVKCIFTKKLYTKKANNWRNNKK